ncbi:MAG: S41 family peptidase, partial [Planctomycetota bacterium]
AIGGLVADSNQAEAIELYREVLTRLEMSYVDVIDLAEVIRGGTAYLEVALTEPSFIKTHLEGRKKEQIESFRTSIHKLTLRNRIATRSEAINIVQNAAKVAEQKIGLQPTTTVVQFTLGAIALLDPYSSFLSSSELEEVESQIEGNFVGLGIALQPHSVPLKILNVIPGGPAEQAGMLAGDEIAEIGQVRCADVGAERAADMLRGPENSHVRLLLHRGAEKKDLIIVRQRVEVPSIEGARILDEAAGVAYLKMSSFQKTTLNELDAALWSLHRAGMKSLIIDLRGNPGGWLDASIDVADRFLDSGRIVSTRGKNGIENQNYNATRSGTWTLPLTLLINQESASASEILAGAIRDNRRGEVIGETTFGKGSVQGLFHTKNLNCGIRLTVSKFYSPSGKAISELGVQPTVVVKSEASDPVHFVAKPESRDVATSKSKDRVLEIARRRLLIAERP